MKLPITFSPLRTSGTALPGNLLLAVKLMLFCLIVKGYVLELPGVWLPMWPALDHLPSVATAKVLKASFCLGTLLVFLHRNVRIGALLCGLPFLLEAVVTRVGFHYANFFCGCFLVLCGLYRGRASLRWIHLQFVVMYFGSGLNKLLDPDWRSGHFMDYWLGEIVGSARYGRLTGLLPEGLPALLLSWSSITIELGLAVLFLIPRTRRAGVRLAILFHIGSTVLVRDDFGVFVIALLVSFLAFCDWPERGSVVVHLDTRSVLWRACRRFSRVFDADGIIDWREGGEGSLVLDNRRYRGWEAFNVWVLLHPILYFGFA